MFNLLSTWHNSALQCDAKQFTRPQSLVHKIQDISRESAGTILPLPCSTSLTLHPSPTPLAPALCHPSATSVRAHPPGGSQTPSRPGEWARTGPGHVRSRHGMGEGNRKAWRPWSRYSCLVRISAMKDAWAISSKNDRFNESTHQPFQGACRSVHKDTCIFQ